MTAIDMAIFIGVCFALIIAVVIGAVAILYIIHGIFSIIKDIQRLKAYRLELQGLDLRLGTQGTGMSLPYLEAYYRDPYHCRAHKL